MPVVEENRQRKLAIAWHMRRREQNFAVSGRIDINCLVNSVDGGEAPNSMRPLVDLTKENEAPCETMATIKEMISAPQGGAFASKWKFFICRSIAPAYRTRDNQCLMLLVDDQSGATWPLRLVNYGVSLPSGSGFPASPSEVPPVGSIFALINPAMAKLTHCGGDIGLICHNPSLLVILGPEHPLLNNEFKKAVWKADLPFPSQVETFDPEIDPNQAGVQYFLKKNYPMAIACFSKGIQNDPSEPKLFANRAACYLAVTQPEFALKDAESGLAVDQKNGKLLLRKANALFALRRYEDCRDFILANTFAETCFGRVGKEAEIAVSESKDGIYDYVAIRNEASSNPYLEKHAPYFPKDDLFTVKDSPKEGRWIIAERDIEPGTLIMASKAFAYYRQKGGEPPVHQLVSLICAKLSARPSLLCGLSLCDDNFDYRLDESSSYYVQIVQIYEWLKRRMIPAYEDQIVENETLVEDGFGLWIWPSFISREKCVDSNCASQFIGDFMFVRASRLIKRGEQLEMSPYSTPFAPSLEDGKNRSTKTSQKCDCKLCTVERQFSSEVIRKRKALLIQMKQVEGKFFGAQKISELNRLLDEGEQLMKPYFADGDKILNTLSMQLKESLSFAYSEIGNFFEAVCLMEELSDMFEKLGFTLRAFHAARSVHVLSLRLGDAVKSAVWLKKTRGFVRILCGDEALVSHINLSDTRLIRGQHAIPDFASRSAVQPEHYDHVVATWFYGKKGDDDKQ